MHVCMHVACLVIHCKKCVTGVYMPVNVQAVVATQVCDRPVGMQVSCMVAHASGMTCLYACHACIPVV